jgi:hypothetical protein
MGTAAGWGWVSGRVPAGARPAALVTADRAVLRLAASDVGLVPLGVCAGPAAGLCLLLCPQPARLAVASAEKQRLGAQKFEYLVAPAAPSSIWMCRAQIAGLPIKRLVAPLNTTRSALGMTAVSSCRPDSRTALPDSSRVVCLLPQYWRGAQAAQDTNHTCALHVAGVLAMFSACCCCLCCCSSCCCCCNSSILVSCILRLSALPAVAARSCWLSASASCVLRSCCFKLNTSVWA